MARAARKGYKNSLEDDTYEGYGIPQYGVSPNVSAETLSEEYYDARDGAESSEEAQKKKEAKPKMEGSYFVWTYTVLPSEIASISTVRKAGSNNVASCTSFMLPI